jgi:hypothetical protein
MGDNGARYRICGELVRKCKIKMMMYWVVHFAQKGLGANNDLQTRK